jgi:hypothetical protein
MAIVVVLVTNLIYLSKEIKKWPLERKFKNNGQTNWVAKTPYKGVFKRELARKGRPHSQALVLKCSSGVLCQQPTRRTRAGRSAQRAGHVALHIAGQR